MPRRIPGLPEHWEQYVLCLVFHLLLPLLPIAIEYWLAGRISSSSLALGVAMYAISVGGSSKSKLMFGLTIVVCIVYSAVFGIIAGQAQQTAAVKAPSMYAGWTLAFIFVIHAAERYNRHVVDKAPYWEFSQAEVK